MAKKIEDIFIKCSLCGGSLEKKDTFVFKCTKCGFAHHLNPIPTVDVIIEKGENEILLVKRGIEPKKDFWDVPGGFIVPGETVEEAAIREIKEELGIEISILEIIGTSYSEDYVYQHVLLPILSTAVRAKISNGEPEPADDVSDFAFFKKEEAVALDIGLEGAKKSVHSYVKKYSLAVIE